MKNPLKKKKKSLIPGSIIFKGELEGDIFQCDI